MLYTNPMHIRKAVPRYRLDHNPVQSVRSRTPFRPKELNAASSYAQWAAYDTWGFDTWWICLQIVSCLLMLDCGKR